MKSGLLAKASVDEQGEAQWLNSGLNLEAVVDD
jgi:hypothetical protein